MRMKLNLKFPHNFKSKIILNRCKRLPLDLPSWTIVAHIGMDGYEYMILKKTEPTRSCKITKF